MGSETDLVVVVVRRKLICSCDFPERPLLQRMANCDRWKRALTLSVTFWHTAIEFRTAAR